MAQFACNDKRLGQQLQGKSKGMLYSVTRFIEYRTVYVIMWKNIVEPDRPQMAIWRMRIACWITEATSTHSEYVILFPVPPQQLLNESPSMLRYANTAYRVVTQFHTN
jgi:hypothetical protein